MSLISAFPVPGTKMSRINIHGRKKERKEREETKREKGKREGKEKEERWTKKIILDWSKSSFAFVCHILWKNLNKLLGQPDMKHSVNIWRLRSSWQMDKWTAFGWFFFHFLLFQYLPLSPPPVFSCSFLPINDLISEETSEEVLPFYPFPRGHFSPFIVEWAVKMGRISLKHSWQSANNHQGHMQKK